MRGLNISSKREPKYLSESGEMKTAQWEWDAKREFQNLRYQRRICLTNEGRKYGLVVGGQSEVEVTVIEDQKLKKS